MASINPNFFSLLILTLLIIISLSWLLFKTLKEGREALKEVNKNSK